MRIVIAGGSGFIGRKLTDLFLEEGHEIVILTRREVSSDRVSYVKWLENDILPEKEIKHADVIVNLAGVSINDGRWNHRHQKEIYESRMTATEELLRIIGEMPEKPSVLINASAIGIYPASLERTYTEEASERANDFLGKTVRDWEAKASQAQKFGLRTVFMRFGVVLGKEGGALPLMALPYKLFAGGTVGSGKQWVSWVHVEDVARAILFAINNGHLQGPVNVTSPSPLHMKDFGKSIGLVLKRPHWLPVPAIAMILALGQKSSLVLEGQHVIPKVLLEQGFTFKFSKLTNALEDLLK